MTKPAPDWRDPNMPVIAYSTEAKGLVSIEPERLQRVCQRRMEWGGIVPDWRNDPTYNLRRKR